MCGFVGVIGTGGPFPSKQQLRDMRDSLVHRGPDDAGEFYDDNIALGFRRLAILDLSPAGHQPMSNNDGSLWIVFNGEIYNHVELRDLLVQKGYSFKSRSDTEVLLALYEHYGREMFSRINGFFAFAIYDKKKNTMMLARDRLGVKPLYYSVNKERISFASELKALKLLEGFSAGIDSTALGMYLRLNFVPGSSCIYKGVSKLPPAHYMVFPVNNPEKYQITRYWAVDWDTDVEDHSEEFWIDTIDELLNDAVRIRLRSDAPIGTFLSGGIDSGLITAIASRISGGTINAFTVSFPGSAHDERSQAEVTAKHLGITTQVEEMDGEGMSLLEQLAPHFDEPFADLSLIPTYQICKKMKDRATVILSGDGGDEMFAGYRYHPLVWSMRKFESIPDSVISVFTTIVQALGAPSSYLVRNARRLALPTHIREGMMHRDICENWLRDVINPEYYVSPSELADAVSAQHDFGSARNALDRAQSGDLDILLPDNMLVKVDRMSMGASVEVRSPFLDYRFAELIPRLPPSLRVKGGQTKYLLRKLAERYLPIEIVKGRKKGFNVSAAQWLSGRDEETMDSVIRTEARKIGLLDEDRLKKLWKQKETVREYGPALLRLYIWALWMRNNGVAGS